MKTNREPVSSLSSGCTGLSEKISELTFVPEVTGPDLFQDIRDFSALWLTDDGRFKAEGGMELLTTPINLDTHSLFSVVPN